MPRKCDSGRQRARLHRIVARFQPINSEETRKEASANSPPHRQLGPQAIKVQVFLDLMAYGSNPLCQRKSGDVNLSNQGKQGEDLLLIV